jgi:hypothetical protein
MRFSLSKKLAISPPPTHLASMGDIVGVCHDMNCNVRAASEEDIPSSSLKKMMFNPFPGLKIYIGYRIYIV